MIKQKELTMDKSVPFVFYFIGKFYDLPYQIKNAPRDVHRCVRKLFDYVKSHLAHKVIKPLKD